MFLLKEIVQIVIIKIYHNHLKKKKIKRIAIIRKIILKKKVAIKIAILVILNLSKNQDFLILLQITKIIIMTHMDLKI